MILNSVSDLAADPFTAPFFPRLKDFLRLGELSESPPGKKEIDGETIFAVIHHYQTRNASEGIWEGHRLYYDLQIVLRGEERIGLCPLAKSKTHTPYDPKSDAELFTSAAGDFITMREGMCMVLGPHDIHMPGIAVSTPSAVRKLVIKFSIAEMQRLLSSK